MKIPTYIINLQHRTDRYNHVINEITKLESSEFQIVDAIKHEIPWKGCLQSHLKCVQLAKNSNIPYVLILEDDVIFTDNAVEILKKTFNELQLYKWDMFFLGANLFSPAYKTSEHLLKLTGAWCAHAYVVHNKFYDTILSLPPNKEIDNYYGELMNKYNVYMSNPMIAYQLPSFSNLQNGFRDYNEAIDRNFLTYVEI